MSGPVVPPKQSVSNRVLCEELEPRRLLSASCLKDINTTTLGSNPEQVVDVGGMAFFVANDGVHGFELWKSDGTADGTRMVKDIVPGPGSSLAGGLTAVDRTLFF